MTTKTIDISERSISEASYDKNEAAFRIRIDSTTYLLSINDVDGLDNSGIELVELSEDGHYFQVTQRSGASSEVKWDIVLYHCEPSYRHYKGRKTDAGDRASRIGERIRQLRNEQSLSITDLAERAGMKRPNLSRLEHGKHVPSLDTLDRLAEALAVPVADLVACSTPTTVTKT